MKIVRKDLVHLEIKHISSAHFLGRSFLIILPIFVVIGSFADVYKAELICRKNPSNTSCLVIRYALAKEYSKVEFTNPSKIINSRGKKYPHNEAVILANDLHVSLLGQMGGEESDIENLNKGLQNFISNEYPKDFRATFFGNNHYHIPGTPLFLMSILVLLIPFHEVVAINIDKNAKVITLTKSKLFFLKYQCCYQTGEMKSVAVKAMLDMNKKSTSAYRIEIILSNDTNVAIMKGYDLSHSDARYYSDLISSFIRSEQASES
jgi:hypothetical protein